METVEEIKTWFLTAFDLVLKHENSKGSTYSKRVQETIHYVKHTILMTCHLEKLQIFRCHKVYLSRHFREETGDTLMHYILTMRIQEAQKLMTTTDLKVYEIAEKVGFKNAQQVFSEF